MTATNVQQVDAALDHVESLGKIYKRARAETERIRPLLAEAIRQAHALGVRQVDIVRATGYTRDQVRKICQPGSHPTG